MIDYLYEVKEECDRLWSGRDTVLGIYPNMCGYGHANYILEFTDRKYLFKINLRHTKYEEVENEIYAYQLLKKYIKVPNIIHKGRLSKSGSYYFIQEWIEGQDAKKSVKKMNQNQRITFFTELGQLIGHMHQVKNDQYSGDLIGYLPYDSIADFCSNRVKNSVEVIQKNHLLSDTLISEITEKLRSKIMSLDQVKPSFVHGDLHLGNIITNEGEIVGVIDFESCKFLDSSYDFVKLKLWVFEEYSLYFSAFLKGYAQIVPIHQDFYERIHLYMGIELLYYIEYFGYKFYDEAMLRNYQGKVAEWNDSII